MGVRGRRVPGTRARAGATPRPADRPQGSGAHRRHPHHVRITAVRRLRAHRGRPDRRPPAGRGSDHDRQDQHARVRRRVADVQHGVRRHPQPVRPRPDLRRVERRCRGRARHRDDPDRRRVRHGRLAAQPGVVLQRRGSAPVARAGAVVADADPVLGARNVGRDGPHRRRCRPADVGRCRARSAVAAVATRPRFDLRRAARPRRRRHPRRLDTRPRSARRTCCAGRPVARARTTDGAGVHRRGGDARPHRSAR
jgi:hypothetical protein